MNALATGTIKAAEAGAFVLSSQERPRADPLVTIGVIDAKEALPLFGVAR